MSKPNLKMVYFERKFASINTNLMETKPKDYDMSILMAHLLETERGYMVKKVYKTTKSGTRFNYGIMDTDEDIQSFREKLDELVENFNKKYDANFKIGV